MKQENQVFIDISICKMRKRFASFFVQFLRSLFVTYFEPVVREKCFIPVKIKEFMADPNYVKVNVK